MLHDADLLKAIISALVAGFGVIKTFFIYKGKSDLTKSQLDMSVERTKRDNASKTISELKEAVARIVPLVKAHDQVVQLLNQSIKGVDQTEKQMTEMMKTLKVQYDNFQSRMDNAQAGGHSIMKRLDSIETEVTSLKTGNIYVKTKK